MTTGDGVALWVYRWLPSGEPRALVQIVHGLAEHAGRYQRLAEALTLCGYGVYACDLRGHGRTAKVPSDLGHLADRGGWQKCLDDLRQVQLRMAADYPGKPVILLGHSMGSTLARDFMARYGGDLAGVVLSGSSGQPTPLASAGRLVARLARLRRGARGHSRMLQSLSFDAFNRKFEPARTKFDWLSRDPVEVDKYVADPLCGFSASTQLWIDLLDAWAHIARKSSLAAVPRSLPVYVISGTHDPVSAGTNAIGPMLARYQDAGLQRVEHRFYPEGRHELFNEINREEVTRNLIAWLDSVIGKNRGP
ncbi:MAG TPA: alpha/beta hydrolase [Candidatus Saccharimonadales bacterium]|nr:alpha/beta hydrolase [Candidatus Saccharimonadales bacterium]